MEIKETKETKKTTKAAGSKLKSKVTDSEAVISEISETSEVSDLPKKKSSKKTKTSEDEPEKKTKKSSPKEKSEKSEKSVKTDSSKQKVSPKNDIVPEKSLEELFDELPDEIIPEVKQTFTNHVHKKVEEQEQEEQEQVEEAVQEEGLDSDNEVKQELIIDPDNTSGSDTSEESSNKSLLLMTLYMEQNEIIKNALMVINGIEFKEIHPTKEFMKDVSSITKTINTLNAKNNSKQTDFLTSNFNAKVKKVKKVKSLVIDTNVPIHRLYPVYDEVLEFLKADKGTLISRAMLLQGINTYVKEQKALKNPDIFVEGDNKSFNLINELGDLFDFIQSTMNDRGVDDIIPKAITYKDIMRYLKYCIIPDASKSK